MTKKKDDELNRLVDDEREQQVRHLLAKVEELEAEIEHKTTMLKILVHLIGEENLYDFIAEKSEQNAKKKRKK